MNSWINKLIGGEQRVALPLLSYPAISLLKVPLSSLLSDPEVQAEGIRLISERFPMPAAMGYMDLSVEAEAFGAHAVFSEGNVPTITGQLVSDPDDAEALAVPSIREGRCPKVIEGIRLAKKKISDKPLLANCIGPFSLAGRLMNVNEILLDCYEDPDMVHTVLKKSTDFLMSYISALRDAGADGVILAEPLAGMLSPALMKEFSSEYLLGITRQLQTPDFPVVYHNCGTDVNRLVPEILYTGCAAYHFGNHADLKKLLEAFPKDVPVLGNLSPSLLSNEKSGEKISASVSGLIRECGDFSNWILSSGCDIPAGTPIENIDAFFAPLNS